MEIIIELLFCDLENIYKVSHEMTKTAIWTKINLSSKNLHLVRSEKDVLEKNSRAYCWARIYCLPVGAGVPRHKGDGSYRVFFPNTGRFLLPERKESFIGSHGVGLRQFKIRICSHGILT